MNLEKKKFLASRALGFGMKRLVFNTTRLADIKEAITKQDIRDLHADGAIQIREITGRLKVERRRTRRKHGSVRKKVVDKKRQYIIITRKLRNYVQTLLNKKLITKERYLSLRKQIRARIFKSRAHLREIIMSEEAKK